MINRYINDIVDANIFEISFKNDKLTIYYYDEIKEFKDDVIIILKNNKKLIIKGKKLRIESLYNEYLIIKGNILSINLGDFYE
ncbi:MAG: hypothetical protein MR296_00665 [Tenericutes bacterium]|nr:hypothetical protein [Mycoplasmatota bacterium]